MDTPRLETEVSELPKFRVPYPSAPFQLEDLGLDAANHGVLVTLQCTVGRKMSANQEGCSVPIGSRDPIIKRVKATRLMKGVLVMFQTMEQRSLFPDTRRDATDAEVVTALRVAIARGGRLPRLAELYLASIGAEYLVYELRGAGLEFVRRKQVSADER